MPRDSTSLRGACGEHWIHFAAVRCCRRAEIWQQRHGQAQDSFVCLHFFVGVGPKFVLVVCSQVTVYG